MEEYLELVYQWHRGRSIRQIRDSLQISRKTAAARGAARVNVITNALYGANSHLQVTCVADGENPSAIKGEMEKIECHQGWRYLAIIVS